MTTLADFCEKREEAFTRLKTAAPDQPITMKDLLMEIERASTPESAP